MKRLVLVLPFAACHPPTGDAGVELARPRAAWSAEPAAAAAASASEAPEGRAAPARPITRIVARTGAPVVLARDGEATIAYVADEDGAAIRVVDVDRQDELSALALPGRPAQLAMLEDGRLVATLRERGELAVLAGTGLPGAPLAVVQRIPVAAEPIGLALAPGDRELLVTSGWGHALTVLAVPAEPAGPLAVSRSWEVAQEPRGVVVSDDGRFAFVSHAVGQSLERIELATGAAARISVAGTEVVVSEEGSDDVPRQACQGFALAKSIAPAGRIYAPEVLAFTGATDQPSAGYGSPDELTPEVFDVAVIDEDRGKALGESLKQRMMHKGRPCVLPRAAAASARGSLFVACLGEDAVVELDGASIAPVTAELRRWPVPSGPVGIAIDDARDRAIVWSQYAHTLTTLATGPAAPPVVQTLVLGAGPGEGLPEQLARGRALFAAVGDPRISKTGQACESCHPDGRQDTLVWSSPNGPRQTPMLAGRLADTAPYGWNGDAKDLASHLKSTMKRLRGTGLAGDDLDALIAYVTALRGPALSGDGALVAEGEAIFRSADAQCASCHGEDGRAPDGVRHDVGSRAAGDQRRELDTPSLAYLAGSAPYYHDGRFATLRELLEKSRGKMGQQRPLSPHEIDALEAYLRTR
jgi:DNA-binding beta-propeller fold protein YncE/mono/diheme cytochrome c family protein